MSYETEEISTQSGAPVELYQFLRGSNYYRFTSAEVDVIDTDSTWESTPISRSGIEVTPERVRNGIQITVPRNNAIAEMFRVSPPTDVVAVTIWRYHRDDAEQIVLWMGRVLGCDWSGARAVLQCEPVSTSAKRNGLRPQYQKNCRHVLFGSGCRLNRDDFSITTTVDSTSGRVITLAELLDLPYAGGYVEWEHDGFTDRRFIREADTDGVLVLSVPFVGMTAGQTVTLYPGCAHDTITCDTVYDNLENFGGTPFIGKNPFDGNPVY
jgi:uncharacterized phage protein (TIGR02218 family)